MAYDRWLLLLLLVCAVGCTAAPPAAAPAAAPPTSASVGATTIVAVQAAPAAASPPCSIWQFLGVPGAAKGVCGVVNCVQSRLGTLFPGLEPKPPLLTISDPANLNSPNPAVSSAASVKADEDAAPQKVKAISYLGTIGCGGCYPEVQDALLAALDDCTEAVRFAAVNALRGTACGQCKVCRKKSCCSPKVMEKLNKVANDVDDTGCYKEPSPRVRRMARLAMSACGGSAPAQAGMPLEGPAEGLPGAPGTAPATPPAEAPSPVVRAVSPATRVAARPPAAAVRSPVVVAAAPARSQVKPVQQPVKQAPVASPAVASPPVTTQPVVAQPVEAAPAETAPVETVPQAEPTVAPRSAAATPAVTKPVPPPTTPTDCGLPVSSPTPPTAAASVMSRTQSAAEAPPAPTVAPRPAGQPAAIKREEPDQPVRTQPTPSGPAAVKEAFPSVVQADSSGAPLAVATGIELMQPSNDPAGLSVSFAAEAAAMQTPTAAVPAIQQAAPQQSVQSPSEPTPSAPSTKPIVASNVPASIAANERLPIVIKNPVRPTVPVSQPPATAIDSPASPTLVNDPTPTAPPAQPRHSGPLVIFQSQAARASVIRNPFVDETEGAGKKQIALTSGNQSLPGESGATASTAQLANWQSEASRTVQGQAPPISAPSQARIRDEQLLAFYQQHIDSYRGPTEVRWLWIHVRFDSFGAKPDAYAAAAALRQAAVEGQLAVAVRNYPQTEIRSFDWTPANRLPSRSIAKALLQMQAGDVSVMMASTTGVEVVQLVEARPTTLSFEQARERVQHDLMNAGH